MARRSKLTQQATMPSDDEVDEFHSNREQILFDEAGEYGGNRDVSESEDEEVMRGEDEDEDEDEEDGDEVDDEDEDEEEEEGEEEGDTKGWGGRKDYYGGDEVEDAEDVKQMAEEAIRQQKQNMKELGIDDYLDEDMEDWGKQAEIFDNKSSLVQMVINEDTDLDKLDKSEKMEILTSSFPEFIPLLKELHTLSPVLKEFGDGDVEQLKKVALSSYLGSIASYFSLFIENLKSGEVFGSMKEHPVMEVILTGRQIWKDVEGLDEESDDEFMDAREPQDMSHIEPEKEPEEAEAEISEDEASEISEKASDNEVREEVSESDSDMEIDITSKRDIKSTTSRPSNDYLESTIDDVDAEDKQKKKNSLRFYTSKIDQAQAKNTEKLTGDLDLPYKERLFERKQRLLEEARKRGASQQGDDLDLEEFNSDDERAVNDVNEMDEHYYQNIKNNKQQQKLSRKQAHKEATKLAKEGKLAEGQEIIGKDGKRALNYQIMKNKGLTAKKRKEVRNLRVKKRQKYDQAKKKLKSVRQVYEGEKGPYAGEKTGIKKGLSRSVKLV